MEPNFECAAQNGAEPLCRETAAVLCIMAKSDTAMTALGLGRVKTPTFNLRVETPSRFRKFENQKCLRLLLREDDRENNSAHSWLVHVFTQPETRFPRYLRPTPNSDRRTDVVGCF